MATEQEIRELKHRHSARLLGLPGVSGVGVERDEEGQYLLAVHLDEDKDVPSDLPTTIEGYPVRYVRSGPFRKLPGDSTG